jgi:hypothetical protein
MIGGTCRGLRGFHRTKPSPGIILVSQKRDVLVAIERLVLAWAITNEEEWRNRMITIPL